MTISLHIIREIEFNILTNADDRIGNSTQGDQAVDMRVRLIEDVDTCLRQQRSATFIDQNPSAIVVLQKNLPTPRSSCVTLE